MGVRISLEQRPASGILPDDLREAMEEALSALDDIELRYRRDRDGLQAWLGPDRSKERLLARLQARYKAEREPVVAWLLQLRSSSAAGKVRSIEISEPA